MKFKIYHAGHKLWMDITGETDETKSPYWGACADDLTWTQRVELQAIAQTHIDHSISSTVNVPEDITKEEIDKIYRTAWKKGCKGITVYRKNCRSGVLIDNKPKIRKYDAPKRPEVLNCDIFHPRIKGQEYFVVVGLLETDPYEVFVGRITKKQPLDSSFKTGSLKKLSRGKYQLLSGETELCPNICDYLTEDEEALTRLVSASLRHGCDITFIVHQLDKTKGDLTQSSKVLARILKKYIKDGTKVSGEVCPECKQDSLKRENGCVICINCSWSKCG